MSPQRRNLTEHDVIVILPSELVRQSLVGLIHLHKFLVGLFIVRIALRMILDCQLSVGLLDVVQRSGFRHTEDDVVAVQRIGVVLVEELLLGLIRDTVLIEEMLEGRTGILKRVLPAEHFIIVGPFVPIGEDFKGLRDILKLGLCSFPMFSVLVRMPFGSQSFIGRFYLKERSVFGNSEHFIVVLEGGASGHEQICYFSNYNSRLKQRVFIMFLDSRFFSKLCYKIQR